MTDKQSEPPKETRFQPGQSGNPRGRRAGSRSKALVALDALGEGEVNDIIKAMMDKAKKGDAQAARIILDRVWPPRKGTRFEFDLPEVSKAEDIPGAIGEVTAQVAEGIISPDEGAVIVGLLDARRKAIETEQLASRIAALEARAAI